MANKEIGKVPLNKERFREVLEYNHSSIRALGNAYKEIGRTEKTIHRCLNEGKISPDLLDHIAKYLNIHPDYLSGVYDERAEKIEDPVAREIAKSHIKPENYPYISKEKEKIDYETYFENILSMNNITIEQFKALPARERVLTRQEIDTAILQVLANHFDKDAFGYDTKDALEERKAYVNDFDPYSYYAKLEGIDEPEPNYPHDFIT